MVVLISIRKLYIMRLRAETHKEREREGRPLATSSPFFLALFGYHQSRTFSSIELKIYLFCH